MIYPRDIDQSVQAPVKLVTLEGIHNPSYNMYRKLTGNARLGDTIRGKRVHHWVMGSLRGGVELQSGGGVSQVLPAQSLR